MNQILKPKTGFDLIRSVSVRFNESALKAQRTDSESNVHSTTECYGMQFIHFVTLGVQMLKFSKIFHMNNISVHKE